MAEVGLKEAPAATPEVVLRRATPADAHQMLELVRVAIGRGSVPRTEAFWRWKHEENPFGRWPMSSWACARRRKSWPRSIRTAIREPRQ